MSTCPSAEIWFFIFSDAAAPLKAAMQFPNLSPRLTQVPNQKLAASLGLEPRQRDPESLVLPLHHEAKAPGDKT